MYNYLSNIAPDCTDILSVRPQNILVQTGQKTQVVHDCDDGSVSVVGLSSASFFDVELQWDYISDTDRSTIFELFHDPTKANGSARTFYWQHPIQVSGIDVLYVVRFLSPLRIVYKPASLMGIETMTLRVEATDFYNFNFDGYTDTTSGTALPAANYEDSHYNLHGTTPVSYTSAQYCRDAQGRILTFGAYVQLCRDSENPGAAGWSLTGATRSPDPTENVGPFVAHKIISAGAVSHICYFWRSVSVPASGTPVGTQYIRVYYRSGVGNKITIYCYNSTAATLSACLGIIGSAAVTLQNAGALTLVSDNTDVDLNCRVMTLLMTWTVPANTLLIGIGPNSSTSGDYIIVLGADVFGAQGAGDITTWRPHVPSSGTTVPVSATKYDYNGGSPRGPRFALTDIPKAVTGLQGPGPGDAYGQLEWIGTPLYSASNITADQNIVVCNETTPMLNFDATGVEVKDGTNTSKATLAFVKDTAYTVKVPYGPNPVTKQMKIIAGSATSALGDNDGNFNPGTYLGIGGSDFPVAHTSFKIKKAPTW